MKRIRNFLLGSLTLPFAKNNDSSQSGEMDEVNVDATAETSADLNANTEDQTGQTEDAVMKSMMQFFADEMLPVFGITQKVKALAPTEQVHIEIRKGLQDFNLVMDDSSIAHFEFQSRNGGKRDLRRFRSYEADASYQLGQPVTTYVLFSGNIKRPMTRITEGINTYRVVPIIMRKKNADTILKKLKKKINTGTALTREDLVMLPLLPVMGGHLSQKERIQSAFRIAAQAKAELISKADIDKIEATIYAMATKFLSKTELQEIKEEFKMNIFSEFINEGREIGIKMGREMGIEVGREMGIEVGREMGIEVGREMGIEVGREMGRKTGLEMGRKEFFQEQVEKKLKKGNSIAEIAAALEQDEDSVRQVIAELDGKQTG